MLASQLIKYWSQNKVETRTKSIFSCKFLRNNQSAGQRYSIKIVIETIQIPMFGADSLSYFIYLDFMCTV